MLPRNALHVVLTVLALALAARADDAAPPPPLPTDSESLSKSRELVPAFQTSSSKHYVLLTDAPADNVQKVISLLEATHDAFHANCRRLKLQPKALRHKLVAILFRDKSAFAAFAKANDGMDQAWAAGYYKPGPDRLVLYDAFSSPDVQKAMAKLAANERKVKAGATASQKQQMLEQIRSQKSDIIDDVEDNFFGTVAHEAAHQLFFHTGIQNPQVPYPRWLAEGLATAFEVDELNDRAVGFFADNPRRVAAHKAAATADRLIPLRVLVTEDRYGAGGGNNLKGELADFYGQAHMLTSWLARSRPTEFRLYLEALRDGVHAMPSRRQPLFESIFGPIAMFERVWMRSMSRQWPGLMDTPWGQRLRDYEASGPSDAEKHGSKAVEKPAAEPKPSDDAKPDAAAKPPEAPKATETPATPPVTDPAAKPAEPSAP